MRGEINCRGKKLSLKKPIVMGILNVTPDSFSDGAKYPDAAAAINHAREMISEGAAIIDVGGESSRPGALPVSCEEELERVLPIVKQLAKEGCIISVDTCKADVARACLRKGAHMINDIMGLADERIVKVCASHKAVVVIMHMKGEPRTMQENPVYSDVVLEIKDFFRERIAKARKAGIEGIILDPGIGFGKTTEHNLEIIRRLGEFRDLGYPLMLGTSRKSFIGKTISGDADERLEGTIASNIVGFMNGARIFRVHDVAENKKALDMAWAISGTGRPSDRITIKGLELEAKVGLTPKERARKQKITADIELEINLGKAAKSGKIEDTVDYRKIIAEAKKIAAKKEFTLLEETAKSIGEELKKRFHAGKTRIKLGKKKIAQKNKASFVGIELAY